MSSPDSARSGYSRLPELVSSDTDLVGLLSYALYKQLINERRRHGISVTEPADRNPLAGEIDVYRNQAESYLRTLARSAIDDERANIIEQGVLAASNDIKQHVDAELRNWSDDIKAVVIRSTRFWPSVIIGVVAWLISLLITLLVVANAPGWATRWLPHAP